MRRYADVYLRIRDIFIREYGEEKMEVIKNVLIIIEGLVLIYGTYILKVNYGLPDNFLIFGYIVAALLGIYIFVCVYTELKKRRIIQAKEDRKRNKENEYK